jgi:TolA-binding protein
MRFRAVLPFAAFAALTLSPASAQRRPPTPEQRIDRLEKQVRQVQRQVFPKGQPADTAGFSDNPAATQDAVNNLNNRLDAVERQLADIVRQAEENGNRVGQMETELARLRADQDRRLRALETSSAAETQDAGTTEQSDQTEQTDAPPPRPRPKVESKTTKPESKPTVLATTGDADADAEAAYDQGYRLWTAGKYDAAVTSLRAMTKKYPDHRRVSWANNLIGRSLLDKGEPRAAAEALLANYRRDKNGERAQDSLFYLGQALVKLGQPGQACKAYAELEDVYSGQVRAPLKAALPNAKAEAKCS